MTSAVTRDDVESGIWHLLGVKRVPSWRVDRLLDTIDKYAASSAHKYQGYDPDDPPLPPIVFPEPVKVAVPVIPAAPKPPLTPRRAYQVSQFKYKCRLCKQRKGIGEFPAGKQADPGRWYACTGWRGGRVGVAGRRVTVPRREGYLCRGCLARKPLEGFPAEKQKTPSLAVYCLACRDEEPLAS